MSTTSKQIKNSGVTTKVSTIGTPFIEGMVGDFRIIQSGGTDYRVIQSGGTDYRTIQ